MFKSIIAVALFAASALATIQFTGGPSSVEAGKSYTFTWTSTGSGPVSILLKNGPAGNLQTVDTITSSGSGGTYTWTAPSTYPPGSYAFEISQGTDVNYWGPVPYTGGSAAASSAAGSVTASISRAPSASASRAAISSGSYSSPSNKTTTSTSSSSSRTLTTTSSAPSASTSRVASSNSAVSLGSPVALVLGALAAMLYLQ